VVLRDAEILDLVDVLEWLFFRTGLFRISLILRDSKGFGEDFSGAGEFDSIVTFYIDDVSVIFGPWPELKK
jgi:hypothetical protein